MLRAESGLQVVAEAANGEEAIEAYARLHPELEVLRLVADGRSNAQVAERIGRTEGTVKVHLKNILQKLDVKDRTEAVTTALRRGFIRLD